MDGLKIFALSFQLKKFFWEISLGTCSLTAGNLLEPTAHLFCTKDALKNYTKFSEKNLWRSPILVKLLAISQKFSQKWNPPFLHEVFQNNPTTARESSLKSSKGKVRVF